MVKNFENYKHLARGQISNTKQVVVDFDEEDINDQLTQNKLKVFNKQVTCKHSFDLPSNKHSLLHYIHVFFFRARNDKIQILI